MAAEDRMMEATPFSTEEQIEVDPQPEIINYVPNRNSVAESEESGTTSARFSVFEFVEENGRTYHSYVAGSYFLPNDQEEIDRLDLQFYLFRIILGGRDYCAPLKNPKHILDIGTGTGKWAIEMARQFPHATVTGTDLSPIQPENAAPNVNWMIEDASELDWGKHKFDYIHTRMLLGAFEDFKAIIKRAFDYLEPGGYMESQEVYPKPYSNDDETSELLDADSKPNKYVEWIRDLDEAAMRSRRPLRIANKLKRWYEEAGFVDVHEMVLKLPIGTWPRDPQFKMVGKFWLKSTADGLQGFSLAWFHRAFGWSKTEIEAYLTAVRSAMFDQRVHMYQKFYVVWGRKPGTPAPSREQTPSPPTTPTNASIITDLNDLV